MGKQQPKIVVGGGPDNPIPDTSQNRDHAAVPDKEVFLKTEAEHEEKAELKDKPPVIPPVDKPTEEVAAKLVQIGETEYKLNEAGDALNKDGTIFKTKTEISELPNADEDTPPANEPVDIDGVIYTINEEGAAVSPDGVVTYTSDELASFEDETAPFSITKIQEDTKVSIPDKDGNPIVYEDTPEGLNSFVNDAYSYGEQVGAQKAISGVFDKYPLVRAFVNHLELNEGNPEGFGNTVDYSTVTLDAKNEAQLKSMIYEGRRSRGEGDDQITGYYNYLKDSSTDNDSVLAEAQKEQKYLVDRTNAINKEQDDRIALTRQAEAKQAREYWGFLVDDQGQMQDMGIPNSVFGLIKSKTLKLSEEDVFTLPDKIKRTEDGKPVLKNLRDFTRYLTEPVTVAIDGDRVQMTRHDLDVYNEDTTRTNAHDVMDAFKRYVGYDVSQYIKEQINKEKVDKIRRLSTKKKLSKGTSNKPTVKKKIVVNT